MSAVTVGFWPQTGHSGFLRSLSSRKRMLSASTSSSRPTSESPLPRMSLMTSVAWITPTRPGKMPSTPPSGQPGTRPGGGGHVVVLQDMEGVGAGEHGLVPDDVDSRIERAEFLFRRVNLLAANVFGG